VATNYFAPVVDMAADGTVTSEEPDHEYSEEPTDEAD